VKRRIYSLLSLQIDSSFLPLPARLATLALRAGAPVFQNDKKKEFVLFVADLLTVSA